MTNAREAVLMPSEAMPESSTGISGFDAYTKNTDFSSLLKSYYTSGFQGRSPFNQFLATNMAIAIENINLMLEAKAKIYLGYTSNMVSSGMRETFCYLAKHKMIDVIVTSAGGFEEDLIKCLAPTFLGDFKLDGKALRARGMNRIGNLLVPNDNYCKFEDWITPRLDAMLEKQKETGISWTPSSIIKYLGGEINDESSIYYWASKNNIPVYCPAITDGSFGDMVYFHSVKNPGLIIDLVSDIRDINNSAVWAEKTGMIVLGGGVIKHHICNANLMRNGADFSVFINTGQEFDGSDAGASPDEAVSWGKIRAGSRSVKVSCDASLIFPLIVAETFAKH